MIEINLLPGELKFRAKKISLELNYFLYLIPVVFGIVICVHIYLAALNITKSYQFSALNNKWKKIELQRKELEDFKNEHDLLSADAEIIQQLIAQRINWSEKLNKLSLNLPSGIWFNEMVLTRKDFTLKGSVISLQKEEFSLINKFINNLKNDAAFFKDFNNLELSSAQKRVVGGYDISDFILIGTLREK
jgi:Tfp pilus assembly protein PilN